MVINAFLAAEDKNFYEHGGIDFTGMARAGVLYAQNFGSNRRPQGASTITQQVAKNFLLTNEVSFTRKIKEALLAMRIERAYSKDRILELYLNEIYLGLGAYGIAAASLVYFDKSVNELTIAEASYLAALPKAPAALHPVRNRDRAIERRNYVVDRLVENGWIKQADADKARKEALNVTCALQRRACVRRRVFRRGSPPRHLRALRREEALRGRAVGAHHARSEDAGDGAQDHGRRPRQFRRGERLSRRGAEARHLRRLGRQARRHQIAVGHLALADGGGAGDQRPVGAGRLPAGPRTRRRGQQDPADRHRHARRRQMGQARGGARTGSGRRPTVASVLQPGDVDLCRSAVRQGWQPDRGPVPPAAIAGSVRRDGGDGSLDRPRACDGRRLLLRPEPVQPRHAGLPAAGLVVQAAGLFDGAGQRLHAVDRRGRRADRNRPGAGRRRVASGKLFDRQVLRPGDAARRAAALAQHGDRAAGAGHRHAADRRIRQALRRL